MCSTPPPMATSWTPEAIIARGEVDGLLGGAALAVDGGGGGLDREPGLEPGVAGDVDALLAELLHAAGDDVLDLGGVDPGPLDDLAVGLGEQVRGMGVLVVALLLVAAADRRARRLDDHDLAALEVPVLRHLWCLLTKFYDATNCTEQDSRLTGESARASSERG